jgi:hypothetical protein
MFLINPWLSLTMQPPISTINMLMKVRQIFLGDENHFPQLIYSQYTPDRP